MGCSENKIRINIFYPDFLLQLKATWNNFGPLLLHVGLTLNLSIFSYLSGLHLTILILCTMTCFFASSLFSQKPLTFFSKVYKKLPSHGGWVGWCVNESLTNAQGRGFKYGHIHLVFSNFRSGCIWQEY